MVLIVVGGGIYAFMYFHKRSQKYASRHGPDDAEISDHRADFGQVGDCAICANAVDDVCRRRALGRGHAIRGRRDRAISSTKKPRCA